MSDYLPADDSVPTIRIESEDWPSPTVPLRSNDWKDWRQRDPTPDPESPFSLSYGDNFPDNGDSDDINRLNNNDLSQFWSNIIASAPPLPLGSPTPQMGSGFQHSDMAGSGTHWGHPYQGTFLSVTAEEFRAAETSVLSTGFRFSDGPLEPLSNDMPPLVNFAGVSYMTDGNDTFNSYGVSDTNEAQTSFNNPHPPSLTVNITSPAFAEQTPSLVSSSSIDHDEYFRGRHSSAAEHRHRPYPGARTRSLSTSRQAASPYHIPDIPRSSRGRAASVSHIVHTVDTSSPYASAHYLTVPGSSMTSPAHSGPHILPSDGSGAGFLLISSVSETSPGYVEPNFHFFNPSNGNGQSSPGEVNRVVDAMAYSLEETSITEPGPSSPSMPDSNDIVRHKVATPNVTQAMIIRRKHPALFKCEVAGCTATFTTKQNLGNHINAHKGIRDFQCDVCTKKFGTRTVMIRHRARCAKKAGAS
ncbi:hypothetical protein BDQ12DRAFT_680383 [Crucibulum laeve]|uniref:C2H2-type domain-containing protein n=1 Tax=Crucibulum laeve TaxID=68775 RepID=A0A5C3M3Y5_9AGAR|nr:hypothetical protein BDQ12DRAFT_680383 [Crucibulum laeve]